jgi:dethiobiotin synthetase
VNDGDPGDVAEVRRLAGDVTHRELLRLPEPLAPNTAARRAGRPPLRLEETVDEARRLDATHDLVLVEGAGGVLAWFDDAGTTVVDLLAALRAPALVVTAPGLGTLNATALTAEALSRRDLPCLGLVIGSWPREPDLAMRCNLGDLTRVSGLPLLGVLPDGMGKLSRPEFLTAARNGLAAELGGDLKIEDFVATAG